MRTIHFEEAVENEILSIIAANEKFHGVEANIVSIFKDMAKSSTQECRIPMSQLDTIVYEMAFKFGRADIVVFHIDGSASVIEVKDGTKGYNHVVSGLGQAGLYAAQLSMNKGTLKKVRKCLLWTSTGDIDADALIEEMCDSNTSKAGGSSSISKQRILMMWHIRPPENSLL